MNERIQELVSMARQQATSDTKDGKCFDVDLFHKKFAELIVEECVQTVQDRGGMCGALAANWIEEHFRSLHLSNELDIRTNNKYY